MNNRDYVGQSLRTLIEMLEDRGIKTGLSAAGAVDLIGSNPNYFEFVIDKTKIVYYLTSKFKWTDLKKSFEEDTLSYDQYILVVREKPTQNNLKFINTTKLPIQIFELRELQFNISKHSLVPRHSLITDQAEIDAVIKDNNLKSKHQLPIILKSDPMAKYLNLKTGDIIKITRVSPTAGEYVVYRCCL